MIETGATHVGVATDHVIESFRNRLWSGYKTGDGVVGDAVDGYPGIPGIGRITAARLLNRHGTIESFLGLLGSNPFREAVVR